MKKSILMAMGLMCLIAAPAHAAGKPFWRQTPRFESKLLLTGGVSNVEGAGGGGLATWATTTGYGDSDGIGGNVHYTNVSVKDYDLRTYGAAVGLWNRVELSYARQEFDTGLTGGLLGVGNGFTFNQDVFGAKVVLVGDAVYDQDRLLPQIAVGAQYKRNDKGGVIAFLGGAKDHGTDYYVAATKVLLDKSLVLDATVRYTDANQFGILGFGAAGKDKSLQFEGSAAYLINRRLAVGAEYRSKPDNLGIKEDDAFDLFAAYTLNRNLSVTAAYVDLGDIVTFKNQRGLYLSLQAGF